MSILFSPIQLRSLTIRNRIVMAPMENRFAVTVPYAEIVRLAPVLKEKREAIRKEIAE